MPTDRPKKSIFRNRNSISIATVSLFAVFASLLPAYYAASGNAKRRQYSIRSSTKEQNKRGASQKAITPEAKRSGDGSDSSRPVLAFADFDLLGFSVSASPASQTVPKNTPTAILTTVPSAGIDSHEVISTLNPNFRVRGELVGPSLSSLLIIEASIGQPLPIPPLSRSGDHVLQNLRIVDTGLPESPSVSSVTPDLCAILVIDQILVSEVRVEELSYEEIIQSGISITDDSYRFFNFVLALATSSTTVDINLPVAFPDTESEDPRPLVGRPGKPAQAGIDIPTVDAVPVMLEIEEETSSGVRFNFEGQPVRIPGVVIFPGRIAFLNQFFEAIVIVSNAAPGGAPLIIRNLRAKVKLPDNGTPAETDDPLRIAATQTGGTVTELEVRGLGVDSKYGTADDLTRLAPGQTGQASFLLEGLKEGLHTPSFELEGTLEGLPSGPVTVRGEVPGAVLVRDASFAVTFSHPSIVRAGNEYDLAMTVYNSGSRDINGAIAQLFPGQISGASLIAGDTGERVFATTIPRKSSSTVIWRLRANATGAVTASYVKSGEGIEAGLSLTTGVGDRNVALSPESLILPDEVRFLPPDVVEAGRALLGQAWSVASAPRGSLPAGVAAITKEVVINRAVEMGVAGLRVRFGERVEDSLMTLMRDWLGELQSTPDSGFADALGNTRSGFSFYDAIGSYLQSRMTSEEPLITSNDLHTRLAETESPRSPFISVLITQPEGAATFGARLIDPSGRRTGFLNSSSERAGEHSMGAALLLNRGDGSASLGQMLTASRPVDGNWFIELTAWQNAVVDISILVPGQGTSYRHALFAGSQIVQGRQYRIRIRPGSLSVFVVEELIGGAYAATGVVAEVNSINETAARLVGALQVSEEVMTSGDKYGRLVGLLFSKPMQKSTSETGSRYKIGGGERTGSEPPSIIGKTINVRSASLQFGGRLVFLGLDAPIGPYIRRNVTVSGINDSRGVPLTVSPLPSVITTTVSSEGRPPGAFLTGRVVLADGNAVANASIVYWTQPCKPGEQPAAITIQKTDSAGRYAIDYVRNGDCGGVVVTATNPENGSQKRLSTPVIYDGQHMVLDLVLLARGSVRGSVRSVSNPAPFAFVKVVSHLDASITPTVQSDALGRYLIEDIPVGPLSVFGVGVGSLSAATGIGAGSIDGPGQTATVDVSLENLTGVIRGRVINVDSTPSTGSLIIAQAELAGFPSGIPVGFAFTTRDGSFVIKDLPLREINLQVKDYVTSLSVNHTVRLSQTTEEVNGIVITLPGFGSIRGKVTDENGVFIPFAEVFGGGHEVDADASGNYELINLRAGTHSVKARERLSGSTGEATATVVTAETANNVNIVITRPGRFRGQVFTINASGQSVPVSNAIVSHDGIRQVTTDAQGKYTIEDVQANRVFTLRFVHPNNRLAININTFVSPAETIVRDATFRSASLRGNIFQPDGSTGTIAELTAFVSLPSLEAGSTFGILEIKEISTHSAANGSYSINLLNPSTYRLRASNAFFPTKVSAGGTLTQGEDEVCNITLVNTLAGRIHGRILRPDGETSAGPNINITLGGGSLADVTVRSDLSGDFEFPEVFAAGRYTLTANDPATGLTNRITISVRQNEDVVSVIRLLGRGTLRIRVVDGAGNAVTGGSISVDGIAHPRDHRFADFTTQNGGLIELSGLSEGDYAISATQNGLSGRASVTVANDSVVEATIQLQASGTIKGRVLMSDLAAVGLADVFLSLNNRRIGVTVTSDLEGETGQFSFPVVPTGNFTLEAFDNRTGQTGRATGTITTQDQITEVDIKLIGVGAVTGIVRQNGQPVGHALVKINASGGSQLQTTTTSDGRYRFTGIPVGPVSVSVTDGPGGLTGHAAGQVAETTDPLADTVINVTLQPSVSVTGTILKFGGSETVARAKVRLQTGSRVIETMSNQNGEYRIEFAPLGELRVRAEAPTGFDRGEATTVSSTEPGTTHVINVALKGTGNLAGNAADQNGQLLDRGTVTYTNLDMDREVVLVGQIQSNGRYQINGAPAGEFSVRLTVPGRIGAGVASSTIVANQTIELPVRMEDAGSVRGIVKRSNGTTPAASADVTLTLVRGTMVVRLLAHTNSQGVFAFENVPLGLVSISVTDPQTGGITSASGLLLNANGQIVDAGTLILDSTPGTTADHTPPVIDPLPIEQTVQGTGTPMITATYRDESSGINISSITLSLDGFNVTSGATVTANGLSFQPASPLASGSHTVSVEITDNAGNIASRTANFAVDNTPPSITNFRIGGSTVINGMTVTSSLRPAFEATYADASGIDTNQTRLLLGFTGGTPVQVAAIVTATSLTFQPASNLTEGFYTTELIVIDSLGNSTTSGQITFRIDADAPEITGVTPSTGGQHGGTRVTLTGSRLLTSNGTSPVVTFASQAATVINSATGATDTVTVITPAGVPGLADITVTTDRGSLMLAGGFSYESDTRMPFALEPDTRLLWRLDETANGAARIADAGPLSIDGTAHILSQSRSGRFGGGRASAEVRGDTDFGSLAFGNSSFTVEVWIKSGPVQRSYTLAGRGQNRPTFSDSEDFAVVLRPTGALEGYLFDTAGRIWLASMAPAVYDIDDDQWHAVAMVVDRAGGILRLYVDGVERATATAPTNFAAMRSFGRSVVAGTFTRGGENGPGEFPGVIDEIRFSASPHSADKIASDLFDVDSIRVTATVPGVLQKGTASQFRFVGTGLTGAMVSASRSDVIVDLTQTTFGFIDLTISTEESVPPGPLQFNITNSTGETTTISLVIVDQRPFENDPTSATETVLLWHLDESSNGAAEITGAGDAVLPSVIDGTASTFSIAEPGRFRGARRKADIIAAQSSSSFQLGTSSFTVECWIKSDPVIRRYALVTRSDFVGNVDDFSLVLHPSGVVEAFLFDTTGKKWQALAQPVTYSVVQSTIARVDDGQWHLITMVADRLTEHLSIYVDGQQRATVAAPGAFGALRNVGHPFRVALEEAGGESGEREFTGVIDEVRIVNFARTAEQIRATWFGTNTFSGFNLRLPLFLTPGNGAASPKGGRQ